MALRVAYNFQADFTHVNLKKTESKMNTSLERLSTGLRINSAKDDAAGLFIADQLGLVSKALDQGSRNANDGISASQIAESTLSQIYDKLTSMYTKASQAATDTNDAQARGALQRDIEAIVDAIDRMAKASEFNGQKLLDGTFQQKKIQYGSRAYQSLDISIAAATADKLGAYTVSGQGSATQGTTTYATLTSNGTNFGVSSADFLKLAGTTVKALTGGNAVVDAKAYADAINSDPVFQNSGIEATAINSSTAQNFSNITTSTQATTIKFYVGSDRTADVTVTIAANSELTLDDLVSSINSQAGDQVTASNVNGKLVLQTNGETIGVEVNVGTGTKQGGTAGLNLNTLLEVSSTTVSSGAGAGVKVGQLNITGIDAYTIQYSGISDNNTAANEGLNFDTTSGNGAGLKSLNNLDVTTYGNAELSMKIIDIAIKKVDRSRSQLGSIQQNLQAIIENNDFAATQTREAESRIRNVDFAKEMAEFTREQTLYQSGVAMMAQANQLPQQVLQLLR